MSQDTNIGLDNSDIQDINGDMPISDLVAKEVPVKKTMTSREFNNIYEQLLERFKEDILRYLEQRYYDVMDRDLQEDKKKEIEKTLFSPYFKKVLKYEFQRLDNIVKKEKSINGVRLETADTDLIGENRYDVAVDTFLTLDANYVEVNPTDVKGEELKTKLDKAIENLDKKKYVQTYLDEDSDTVFLMRTEKI